MLHAYHVVSEHINWDPRWKDGRISAATNRHVAVVCKIKNRNDFLFDVQPYFNITRTVVKDIYRLVVKHLSRKLFTDKNAIIFAIREMLTKCGQTGISFFQGPVQCLKIKSDSFGLGVTTGGAKCFLAVFEQFTMQI